MAPLERDTLQRTSNLKLTIKKARRRDRDTLPFYSKPMSYRFSRFFSGHYFDEFVKDDGTWRFVKTVVHNPLVGDMSQHLKAVEFISGDD